MTHEDEKVGANIRWRTVLIEHENLSRTMLAKLILLSERFTLVADFGEVPPVRDDCLKLNPELVVIDVDFAPEQSVAFIDILIREHSSTRVLALSGSNDPGLLHRLAQANVHGYVPRDESIESLEEAMMEVASGRRYLPAAFIRSEAGFSATRQSLSILLTEKERQILCRVAAGRTSRAIAVELKLSPRSVETYRCRIMRKLGVPNTAALVDYAIRSGISKSEIPVEIAV